MSYRVVWVGAVCLAGAIMGAWVGSGSSSASADIADIGQVHSNAVVDGAVDFSPRVTLPHLQGISATRVNLPDVGSRSAKHAGEACMTSRATTTLVAGSYDDFFGGELLEVGGGIWLVTNATGASIVIAGNDNSLLAVHNDGREPSQVTIDGIDARDFLYMSPTGSGGVGPKGVGLWRR